MFGQAGPWNDVTTEEEEEEEEEGEEELEDTYHLVLPSRFGELEFVTLVVHILRSAIRRACPKRLPSRTIPLRVSQWASLSNKW